jgi:hypothetical protein
MAIGELQKVRRLFVEVAQENPRAARAHVRQLDLCGSWYELTPRVLIGSFGAVNWKSDSGIG